MMLTNYLSVAFRNMRKHRFFTLINIAGLTIGITAVLLISIFVMDELSYDRFHQQASRIYQLGLKGSMSNQSIETATTCPPLAEAMATEIPDVEASIRLVSLGEVTLRVEELVIEQSDVLRVDSNFFEFFDGFKLKEGDAKTCLLEPNSIVLTESTAKMFFGNEPAMGKMMIVGGDKQTCKVTGIVAEPDLRSHFKFTALLAASGDNNLNNGIWLNNYLYTYVRIRPEASFIQVQTKLAPIVEKNIGPELEKYMGVSLKAFKAAGNEVGYFGSPMTEIHLNSPSEDNIGTPGSLSRVYLYIIIAGLILVIACINFMNLATARSAGRAKEVGMRKTMGSFRWQMMVQFLLETGIYIVLSVIIALAAVYFLLPYFGQLVGKTLEFKVVFSTPFVVGLGLFIFLVSALAGSYPAFYLTAFNPVDVLKGKVRTGMKSKGIRSGLVVLQFGISVFLIIFTLVVYNQIQFLQQQNLGLDKSHVLILNHTDRISPDAATLKEELKTIAGVEVASFTNNYFPGVNNTTIFRKSGEEIDHIMGLYYADHDHLDLMKYTLVQGRFLSKDFPSDSSAIVINEAAVREFGLKDPIGVRLTFPNNGVMIPVEIVGVVKDYNFESFKSKVRPIAIGFAGTNRRLMIRYQSDDVQDLLARVEGVWKKHAPDEPFSYAFLDQQFDRLFKEERQMGETFAILAGLTIFIAALGLFALAAFIAEQRTKEIGIRKALGASVSTLVILLSAEFTYLVLISLIPAAAAGYYFGEQWLSTFAYQKPMETWIFLVSGAAALVIAWLTVIWQAAKAARTNPILALRYE